MKLSLLREYQEMGISALTLGKLILFTVLFAFFEGIGIGMLLPVLEYIEGGGSRVSSGTWDYVSMMFQKLGVPPGPYEILGFLFLAFLALLMRSVLNYIRDISVARLKYKISGELRKKAIYAYFYSDFSFFSSHQIGEIQSALTSESDRAADALASHMAFITALTLALIYLILMFVISPPLALLTIPICMVVGSIFSLQSRALHKLSTRVSIWNRMFGGQINDRLQGMLRIKMEGQETEIAEDLSRNVSGIVTSLFDIEKRRILVEIGIFPLLVLASFTLLFLAVDYLKMSLASLGIFLFLLMRLSPHLMLMNTIWSYMNAFMASFDALKQSIQKTVQHREPSGGKVAFEGLRSDIRLVDLGFRYPLEDDRKFTLQSISAVIVKGSLTALVGRSGSGKSTLVKLITGLFPPQKGTILFNDRPITDFNLASLRRKIAMVPQEPYFFDGTIRSNITFGLDPVPHETELEYLLDQTGCTSFLKSFDHGIETVVGQRGNRLSQGQRQRLAIVHALAKKPDILVLDEPTSALDSESEQAIRQTLQQWRGTLTILVIAHRLSTIAHANRILVMDNGRLVAVGTHESLIEMSSLYRGLFENQMVQ